jgi:hypothetical protein
LTRIWDNPPSDPTTLRLLTDVTGQIRDQRLLDKMTALAVNPAGTKHARLSAIAVLVSYFDPHVFILFPAIADGTLSAREYVRFGSRPDPSVRDGAVPLNTQNTRSRVHSTLRALGGDSDPRISTVARMVEDWLGRSF